MVMLGSTQEGGFWAFRAPCAGWAGLIIVAHYDNCRALSSPEHPLGEGNNQKDESGSNENEYNSSDKTVQNL